MEDLYKIEKPFGLLDKETQDALLECEEVEIFCADGEWRNSGIKPTFKNSTYRRKSKAYLPGVLYEWKGGPQPVPDHWLVQWVIRGGSVIGADRTMRAGTPYWEHLGLDSDIVAFVIRECE